MACILEDIKKDNTSIMASGQVVQPREEDSMMSCPNTQNLVPNTNFKASVR